MRNGGILVTIGALVCMTLSCGGDDGGGAAGVDATGAAETESVSAATPAALTEAAPFSGLLVEGRDRFRACVQVLDDRVSAEQATADVEQALLAASRDRRWHRDFLAPAANTGCRFPPAALAPPDQTVNVCSRTASQYLVHVFVGRETVFEDSFPEERLEFSFPVAGLRRGVQEELWPCTYQVSEAWYITPDELQDSALMENYIFGIFHIAAVPE